MEAEELRFAEDPDVTVRFTGGPGRDSVSDSSRRNLPRRVKGGTDYRNVRVDYVLATRLVAEKLDAPSPTRLPGP